jgi:glycosyltransferase involved in cell wall biosynthesis
MTADAPLLEGPLVSVVIPSYNRASLVGDAIDSALAQTHRNTEIIVVDDGSTDDTDKIMERYAANPRVRYLKHPTNRGIPAARNTGIRHARGEYIALLDSDDMWLPNKLETQLQVFRQDVAKEVAAVWSDAYVVDVSGNTRTSGVRVPREVDLIQLFRHNFIIAQTTMMRRACVDRVGLFDEDLRGGSDDYDMWLRLARHFKLRYVRTPLATIRLHGGNYSSVQGQARDNFVIIDKTIAASPELRALRRAKLGRLHYRLGLYHLEEGHGGEARGHLRQAIRWNPVAVKPLLAWTLASCGPAGMLAMEAWRKFRR